MPGWYVQTKKQKSVSLKGYKSACFVLLFINAVAIGTAPVPELSFSTGTAFYCACAFPLAGFRTSRISRYVNKQHFLLISSDFKEKVKILFSILDMHNTDASDNWSQRVDQLVDKFLQSVLDDTITGY